MNSPLPISTHVSVNPLAQSLSDTTNSYKFYWLLAILNLVLKGQKRLSVDELVVEMICESWHPIKQFKLDHGPQDKLGASIERIAQYYSIEESISKSELGQVLRSKVRHQVLQKHLKTFHDTYHIASCHLGLTMNYAAS